MNKKQSSILDTQLKCFLQEFSEELNLVEQPRLLDLTLPEAQGSLTVLLTQSFIGADDALGLSLLKHFINSLSRCSLREKRLILMHSAVKLACPTSPLAQVLYHFQKMKGIVMVCEVSAHHYDSLDKIIVGRLANIDEICQCLISASKVIKI